MACHLAASAPGMAQQTAESETRQVSKGRPVTQIRVVDESGKNTEERIPPLPLAPGKPFDFAVERESLRKLYAMGDFSDIRVATMNEGNGVAVDFVVKRNYYNNLIHIEGLEGASQRGGGSGRAAAEPGRTLPRKLPCAKRSDAWKTPCTMTVRFWPKRLIRCNPTKTRARST